MKKLGFFQEARPPEAWKMNQPILFFIKVEDVRTLCGPEKDAARSKPKLYIYVIIIALTQLPIKSIQNVGNKLKLVKVHANEIFYCTIL